MKIRLLLMSLTVTCCQLMAQTYGNEWIEPGQVYMKFEIAQDGIYRIRFDELNAALSAEGYDLSAIDPRHFQIFYMGEEEYIHVEGEADGSFDETDFIEFFGRMNDGTFDTQLFNDPEDQINTYISLFTDTSAYFLTWNSSLDNRRLSNELNDLTDAPAEDTHFAHYTVWVNGGSTVSLINSKFSSGQPYLDIYASTFDAGEGYTDTRFSNSARTKTLAPANRYLGEDGFDPTLETAVVATNEVPHHYTITVNGEVLTDTSFTGYDFIKHIYTLDTLLGSNTVTYTSLEGSTDYIRNCHITIRYPHIWDFNNSSKRKVELIATGAAARHLELTDFNERSTEPLMYDFTAHTRMTGIIDGGSSRFHLTYNADGHSLFFSSQDTIDIKDVVSFESVQMTDFNDAVNQGDFIILTHAALRDDGTGMDWVQEYADYRESSAGGGFNVRIMDIEEVYNVFGYGIRNHPAAIRNMALFAVDSFDVPASYLFLIGKARRYDAGRTSTDVFNAIRIPTFGNPGSDMLLTARPGTYVPALPVGRLVAYTGDEVRVYLEKVTAFEEAFTFGEQTIADKAWMKNVLHFAGGLNEYEQALFDAYLTNYGNVIGDTLFGANVTQFNKITTDPIFYETSDFIDSLVNAGTTLITFFGHSTTGSFDYNIGDPEDFNNEGRYHVIFGNGCNTAAIFDNTITLGEKYINTEDRAAVGFIAATTFSLAGSLNNYGQRFYSELSRFHYGEALGDVMQGTAEYLASIDNIYDLLTSMHTTLQGDPALKLYPHELPDYVIEEPYVYFEPEVITTAEDSFKVNVVVTNIGRAIDEDYTVSVERTKTDGSVEFVSRTLRAAQFRDTVTLTLFTDANLGTGINSFTIEVDKGDSIEEIAEWNNILTRTALILGDDAVPIYPYEFALLNEAPGYLAASTSNPFIGSTQYIIEIDTTQLYNSPLKQSTIITQSGGVLRWDSPPVSWQPGKVYYWRVSRDTSDTSGDLLWRESSFRYQPGDEIGWNQSHYFQYLDNDYNNTLIDDDRAIDFVTNFINYEVATGIYPVTDWTEVTSYINGENIAVGSCASAGFVVFVIDPVSGYSWEVSEVGDTDTGPYGDIYCSGDAFERMIQFNTNTLETRTIFYNFLTDTVPDGHYILMYSNNYPEFDEWLEDTTSLGGVSLFDAFTEMGATSITALSEYDTDRSYIFFAKKGDPATAFEVVGDTIGNKIEAEINIPGTWDEGSYTGERVGPSAGWEKIKWSFEEPDALGVDSFYVDLLGEDLSGNEFLLATGLQSGDTTISWVDHTIYPFVKLRAYSYDDSLYTPVQLEEWQVVYVPVPEAALNASAYYSFNSDTLSLGETLQFGVSVDNVSRWDMDSLLIDYRIQTPSGGLQGVPYERQDSLLANQSMISNVTFDTRELPAGNSILVVEVNPANDQPEQYHFNNVGYIPFYVMGDVADPLVDVTFDGIHILDGDIVSARPNILISLKDENPYLALNDTSLLDIALVYPDGTIRDMVYDGVTMRFIPADTSNLTEENKAVVEMEPVLDQDGIYELQVKGEDATGNAAGGGVDYRISFEVINKAMISNVLTYPNPFTTQTRFVFTLTGSEVPEYLKVQILTVSGKVIREILKPELGPLHIGNNITEFAWDGTDKFGDPVGNGLYLYRVVASTNGTELERYDTGTDRYFESGLGKMYLAR